MCAAFSNFYCKYNFYRMFALTCDRMSVFSKKSAKHDDMLKNVGNHLLC